MALWKKFVLSKVDNNYGKKFMIVWLLSAEEAYNSQQFDSLESVIEKYSDNNHMTALLLHLKKYLKDNKEKFSNEADPIIRHLYQISKETYHWAKKLLMHTF